MSRPTPRLRALMVALLAIFIGGGAITIIATPNDHSVPPATTTVPVPSGTLTVPVDGLDAGKAPDRTIEVPKATVQAVAPALEDDLHTETPAIAPTEQLDAAKQAAGDIAGSLPPLPTAGATAGFEGCRTSFVRNQSGRHGVRPTMMTLHYTVSPNRPGWGDVNAVVALFDRTSSQASSNFVIDGEGHCAYIVPIEAKAWTQAAGNPFSVSVEVIDDGNEGRYMPAAGMAKLRSVLKTVSHRTGIPMRLGAVNNCVPTRSGIVQHKAWGLCGGGHVDITPFHISTVVKQLVAGSVTTADHVTCRKLNSWRHAGRPKGRPQRNASRRKNALRSRGVTCTSHGPVRS